MDAAHQNLPFEDWPPPPPYARPPRRLFLPGDECVFRVSVIPTTPAAPGVVDPAAPPTTPPPVQYQSSLDLAATGNTVPADVVDPFFPLPSATIGTPVYNCRGGPPPPPPPPAPVAPAPAAPAQQAAATGQDAAPAETPAASPP
jgi:hypothetical protein